MHVLYFHQYFSTREGSTATRSYEMAQKLIKRGHSVTMVCASFGPAKTGLTEPFRRGRREGIVEGIHVIELELPISNRDSLLKRTWSFLKYSLRSSWIALFTKCDLVFATSTPLTAAIPGLTASWLRWRPFVFEVRDLWPELPKAMGVVKNPIVLWLMGWLEKRAYRASKACIGLAPGIAEGIARHIPMAKVAMIPNGCDLEFFDPNINEPWRPETIPQEDFVAIFAGTHGRANGLDAVLNAAACLKKRGRKDIRLLLVGDGKTKDNLIARAKNEGLDNVVFHGNVSKERVPGLLRGANVGMQILANVPAFYYGTSPNKFFDYLAAGIPVLNNYPGWVADLIESHQCGKAICPDDPEGFADALCYLADHRELCDSMGQASRDLAMKLFDRDKLSDQFVAVLEGACPQTAACVGN
jgi:glycosyltransferase involved in cell wall biosynthesis